MYKHNLIDNTYARKFNNYVSQFQEDYNRIIKDTLRSFSSHLGDYGNKEKSLLTPGRTLSPCSLGGIK